MPPPVVVEDFDTLGDLSLSLLTCHIASLLDQFVLQCSPETLSIGVSSSQFPPRDIEACRTICCSRVW
jgi:hypothetical protein